MDTSKSDSLPWYRQFWPWFLIALLVVPVLASLVTLWIAIRHSDSLVKDDWYEAGQAINLQLERDEKARRLGVGGDFFLDSLTGEVWIDLQGEGLDSLDRIQLMLIHPTLSERDLEVEMNRLQGTSRFRGQVPTSIQGRWYLEIIPAGGDLWRLKMEMQFPLQAPVILEKPL